MLAEARLAGRQLRKSMGKYQGNLVGKSAALALALLGPVACARQDPVPAEAIIRLSDQFTGDFALVDVDGAPKTDEDFRGKFMLVYFGFATCPDVCPMALARIGQALDELEERDRAAFAPLFITVDPERDTPAALKTYLSFDERLIGLTGETDAVDKARASFKVYAKKVPLPDSALGYTMDHTSLFYVVGPDGKLLFALRDSLTPSELASVLRRTKLGKI
jgi:protein SCO1/2